MRRCCLNSPWPTSSPAGISRATFGACASSMRNGARRCSPRCVRSSTSRSRSSPRAPGWNWSRGSALASAIAGSPSLPWACRSRWSRSPGTPFVPRRGAGWCSGSPPSRLRAAAAPSRCCARPSSKRSSWTNLIDRRSNREDTVMNAPRHFRTYLLSGILAVAVQPLHGFAQQKSGASRDGEHAFDFEIGTWKTHLSRLLHPLSGSTTWVEYEGTSVVRKLWNGRANLLELEVDGPAGHIEGLALRLYNPQSHQSSLNYATSSGGTMSQPTIGEFKNGRGELFDQEPFNGRAILVCFIVSDIKPDLCRFEQSFSG